MSLKQALDMIDEGKIIAIYCGRRYRAFVKDIDSLDLDKQSVAYCCCNNCPGLLDDGEWEWYLRQPEHNSEITDCGILARIAYQNDIPHREYYKQ